MEKNIAQNGLLTLTKLEEERVDKLINPSDYKRRLIRQQGLETKRSQSMGNLNEIHQIAPSSTRYCGGSPYINPR